MNTQPQITFASLFLGSYKVALERHLRYCDANPEELSLVDAVSNAENCSHEAARKLLQDGEYAARVTSLLALSAV